MPKQSNKIEGISLEDEDKTSIKILMPVNQNPYAAKCQVVPLLGETGDIIGAPPSEEAARKKLGIHLKVGSPTFILKPNMKFNLSNPVDLVHWKWITAAYNVIAPSKGEINPYEHPVFYVKDEMAQALKNISRRQTRFDIESLLIKYNAEELLALAFNFNSDLRNQSQTIVKEFVYSQLDKDVLKFAKVFHDEKRTLKSNIIRGIHDNLIKTDEYGTYIFERVSCGGATLQDVFKFFVDNKTAYGDLTVKLGLELKNPDGKEDKIDDEKKEKLDQVEKELEDFTK